MAKTKLKSDTSEIKRRVLVVYGLILQGIQTVDILRFASEKYNVSDRQVETYIKRAKIISKKDNDFNIEEKRAEIIAQYYHLYQLSYEQEDYKECRNLLKEIADIIGVKAAKVHVLEGNPHKPLQMLKPQIIIKERDFSD